MRTQIKGKGLKNLFPWDEQKLKQVKVKTPLWKGWNCESTEGQKVKNTLRIVMSKRSPLTKANILEHQNWTWKLDMKIDFSKVIFMDESCMTFDWPDGWTKGWILPKADIPLVKRRQKWGSSVMILAEIINQTIIRPFKVDEGVKLNNAIHCNFMDKTFCAWYKSQSGSFKVKCIFMYDVASQVSNSMYLILCEFFGHKIITKDNRIATIKS